MRTTIAVWAILLTACGDDYGPSAPPTTHAPSGDTGENGSSTGEAEATNGDESSTGTEIECPSHGWLVHGEFCCVEQPSGACECGIYPDFQGDECPAGFVCDWYTYQNVSFRGCVTE